MESSQSFADRQYPYFIDLAQQLVQAGIRRAVLCPGSRSAAPALSFLRNESITCSVIADERAAAYTAMGMAIGLQQPVALLCTSGTAAANFFPAVVEAFFMHVPLFVLTTDRPAFWINQNENQTIFQDKLYGKHVKAADSWSVNPHQSNVEKRFTQRRLQQLIHHMSDGPVHLNLQIQEPFYPSLEVNAALENKPYIAKTSTEKQLSTTDLARLAKTIEKSSRIVLLPGLMPPNTALAKAIQDFCTKSGAVVWNDVLSNLRQISHAYIHVERYLPHIEPPELLISFGGSIVSKKIREFLRKHTIEHHWHIEESDVLKDTFLQLSEQVQMSPLSFFRQLSPNLAVSENQYFKQKNQKFEAIVAEKWSRILEKTKACELTFVQKMMEKLPPNSVLHLGNSLPVRHVSLLGKLPESVEAVYGNRGTSGIDGSLSTAVGIATVKTKVQHIVLLGEHSFLYDSNALWNKNLPKNLKIVVINNGGGGIFKMIPGPSQQPELEDYFFHAHNYTCEHLSLQFGLSYRAFEIKEGAEKLFEQQLNLFFNVDGSGLMEIFAKDANIFEHLRQAYKAAANVDVRN